MPQLEDFSAWITIEDKKADEFNVETSDDGKCVTCWIVSEVGKASQAFLPCAMVMTPSAEV
jgi:hypothetical protein